MKTIIKTSVIIIALLLALTSNANDDVNGRKNAEAVIFSGTHVPGQEYKTLGPTTNIRDYSIKYATDLNEIEVIAIGKKRLTK